MAGENGRPAYEESVYESWLDDMKPFLKQGASLNFAMEKATLTKHKTAIYEKYKLGDWFSEKVDTYRAYIGELTNNFFAMEVERITDKRKSNQKIDKEEYNVMEFVAEKHRSAQPFFANRSESAEAPPVGKILDELERNDTKTDYSKLGPALAEQGVAPNPPVQDTQQAGPVSNVPTEPNPA